MPHWVEWWLPSPTQRCDGFILAFLHNNQQSPSITQCFGLWQCQFWFDSWFEDKTSFCWVLPLYYSNEIFCTVHHQTLPKHFSSNDPSSVVRCWSRRFESKIKTDILRLGWGGEIGSSAAAALGGQTFHYYDIIQRSDDWREVLTSNQQFAQHFRSGPKASLK